MNDTQTAWLAIYVAAVHGLTSASRAPGSYTMTAEDIADKATQIAAHGVEELVKRQEEDHG